MHIETYGVDCAVPKLTIVDNVYLVYNWYCWKTDRPLILCNLKNQRPFLFVCFRLRNYLQPRSLPYVRGFMTWMVNFNQLCSLQSPRNILTDVSFQCKGVTKLHARDEDLKNRSDVLDTDDLIMHSNESKKKIISDFVFFTMTIVSICLVHRSSQLQYFSWYIYCNDRGTDRFW